MPKVGAETGGEYGSLLLPGAQRASIIRTLNQKVCQKRVPSTRKSAPRTPAGVKNAYPQAKSASKTRTLNPKVRPPRPRRASKTRTLSKKVCQKRVPSARNSAPRTPAGVKNAYPQAKSVSKTRTLSPKMRPPYPGGCQKHVPSAKKCVKNTYPQPESPCILSENNMSRPHETKKCLRKQTCCGRLDNIKHAKTRTRRVFLRSSRPPVTPERCGGASPWQCRHGKRRFKSIPDGHAHVGSATI